MTEHLLDRSVIVTVIVVAITLVMIEWLKQRCWHQWEDNNPPRPVWTRTGEDGKPTTKFPQHYDHLLRCSKCGSLKVFRE